MKRFLRIISTLTAALMTAVVMPMTALTASAAAGSISGAKDGTVYIEAEFNFSDDKPYIFDFGSGYEFTSAYSTASGFLIGNEGEDPQYVVTNAHVVLDETAACVKSGYDLGQSLSASSLTASSVKVYFSKAANEFMYAKIEKVDEAKDLCVLKLPEPTDKRIPLVICKSSEIDKDDTFASLGFPGDATRYQEQTDVTRDTSDIIVSRGDIMGKSTNVEGVDVYQIGTDIRAGNSGGPLVNSKGEVVGINTYSVGELKYAIVIDELLSIINRDAVPYTLSTEVASSGAPAEAPEEKPEEKPEEAPAETTAETTAAPAETTAQTTQQTTQAAPAATTAAEVPAAAEPQQSSSDNTMIIVIAAVVVVVVIAAAVVVVTKNKKPASAAPAAPVQPMNNSAAPVRTSNGAVITGMKGIMANRSFNINGSITLGRNTQKCNICFPVDSKGISGVHCQIRQTNGGYEIVDLGSSNGTFLGSGQKLTPNVPVFISDGTYFYLGSAEQLFQIKY